MQQQQLPPLRPAVACSWSAGLLHRTGRWPRPEPPTRRRASRRQDARRRREGRPSRTKPRAAEAAERRSAAGPAGRHAAEAEACAAAWRVDRTRRSATTTSSVGRSTRAAAGVRSVDAQQVPGRPTRDGRPARRRRSAARAGPRRGQPRRAVAPALPLSTRPDSRRPPARHARPARLEGRRADGEPTRTRTATAGTSVVFTHRGPTGVDASPRPTPWPRATTTSAWRSSCRAAERSRQRDADQFRYQLTGARPAGRGQVVHQHLPQRADRLEDRAAHRRATCRTAADRPAGRRRESATATSHPLRRRGRAVLRLGHRRRRRGRRPELPRQARPTLESAVARPVKASLGPATARPDRRRQDDETVYLPPDRELPDGLTRASRSRRLPHGRRRQPRWRWSRTGARPRPLALETTSPSASTPSRSS